MEQIKIDRINELSKLSKQRELTAGEQAERQVLRREYLDEWRRGVEQTLDNTYIDDGSGELKKLKEK